MGLTKKQKLLLQGCAVAALALIVRKSKLKKRAKVSKYFSDRRTGGRFTALFSDVGSSTKRFSENFLVEVETFDELRELLKPFLQPKRKTRPKDIISPEEKVAAVLEYLGSGALQRHVADAYRISKQHFGCILDDVCLAIIEGLSDQFSNFTKQQFADTANEFQTKWKFPNCLGAIGGKHVTIKSSFKAGGDYKGFRSVVLLAVADANYRFTFLDVGAYGRESDGSIFEHSVLGKAIVDEEWPFPEDASVNGEKLPFFFVADDEFPLHKRLMTPFVSETNHQLSNKESEFNERLSRAGRCVENALGIMCSRFHCLTQLMICNPSRATKILMACCYLHNFFISKNQSSYYPPQYGDYINEDGNLAEGEWRRKIPENSMYDEDVSFDHGEYGNTAQDIRQRLKIFVN